MMSIAVVSASHVPRGLIVPTVLIVYREFAVRATVLKPIAQTVSEMEMKLILIAGGTVRLAMMGQRASTMMIAPMVMPYKMARKQT